MRRLLTMDASAHRLLESFTPIVRERLLEAMIREDYADGAYLFHEGDRADGVYLVLEGEVEIVRIAGRQEKILDLIVPGDYFGEVAVLDGFGRSAGARARGTTSIAKIPGTAFLEALETSSGTLTVGLLQHILADMRRLTDQVVGEIMQKEKLTLVGEMASSLMHDLRTPVSSIRLSADLIDTASGDNKIVQWCDGIRRQCDRLVGMATELMEFSKSESRLSLNRTNTTVFLEQFKTLNEEGPASSGIEIRFHAEPGEIEIDTIRMHRVLQNLVNNAVEALDATPQPCIEIRAWVNESTFHLAVKDNGPGIPAAIKSRIFEPFVTHGKSDGIGLGMAIVRNIVMAHRGTITFETAADQGTAFLISLPQGTMAAG